MGSILSDVKKMLAIPEEAKDFDQDLLIFINSAFASLHQLGVGPPEGFSIDDETQTWDGVVEGPKYNDVKTYIYLKVRVLFDPPTVATVMNAYNEQINKFEWLLNTRREVDKWESERPTS